MLGEPGNIAYVFERGEHKAVAEAYKRAAGRVLLADAWPGLAGIRTYVNIDAGLFRIKDLNEWTSQVFGVGRVGELIDLNVDTLNLDLIGCPVWANGGASGQLRGEVQALFYRYRAAGGFDYVADLLIGPREDQDTIPTRPGDSGTLWFWDVDAERPVPLDTRPAELADEQAATAAHEPAVQRGCERPPRKERTREYRPIAAQWGGHSFLEPGGQAGTQFALATSLASICRLLDVELVRDHGVGHSQYWGKVGHYKIAISACALVASTGLASLLETNATRISMSDDDNANGNLPALSLRTRPAADGFYP